MAIEVIPASPDQEPILANLLELYAHDFSEFYDIGLGSDGKFGYPHLPLYWTEAGRHPFLIKVDGQLAGLALVKRTETGWDMAEFFVVRGHRRHGIGTDAAHAVWRRFPGLWEVRVMESNRKALPFWERAISAFVGKPTPSVSLEKGGRQWRVFSFHVDPLHNPAERS